MHPIPLPLPPSHPAAAPSRGRAPLAARLAAALVALALVAAAPPAAADLDVVFVLDTTGSMSAEIAEVQERVHQLAVSLARSRAGERIRFGIVAFRDRGDDYVTLLSPLTEDVPATGAFLASLAAGGGGDGPESVVAALDAALDEMQWDVRETTERQIFLVGDAPPHLDYGDEPAPAELAERARRQRIVVNTIGCRSLPPDGVDFFRQIAYATEGSYQHIGSVAAAAPGALTAAVDRTVSASAAAAVASGETVAVRPLARPAVAAGGDPTGEARRPGGLLVRQRRLAAVPGQQGQQVDATGCVLEVELPLGAGLAEPPRVRRTVHALHVELALVPGDGGRQDFALAACPALETPIHVTLGGA